MGCAAGLQPYPLQNDLDGSSVTGDLSESAELQGSLVLHHLQAEPAAQRGTGQLAKRRICPRETGQTVQAGGETRMKLSKSAESFQKHLSGQKEKCRSP